MVPTLWYAFRYLPRTWRYRLAEALVWGGGYVMDGFVEPSPTGSVRGFRQDCKTGERWYHESWLAPPHKPLEE